MPDLILVVQQIADSAGAIYNSAAPNKAKLIKSILSSAICNIHLVKSAQIDVVISNHYASTCNEDIHV